MGSRRCCVYARSTLETNAKKLREIVNKRIGTLQLSTESAIPESAGPNPIVRRLDARQPFVANHVVNAPMLLVTQSVRVRVAFLIGAAIVSMIALAAVLIMESQKRIADFHLENAKTALEASLALLRQEQNQVEAGTVSLAQAQARSLALLRAFRCNDGEGYVAIIQDDGFMIMHPVHEHFDQANLWDFQDSTGDYIAREAINIGLTEAIGVNRYYFEHPITGLRWTSRPQPSVAFRLGAGPSSSAYLAKVSTKQSAEMLQRTIVVVAPMSC